MRRGLVNIYMNWLFIVRIGRLNVRHGAPLKWSGQSMSGHW